MTTERKSIAVVSYVIEIGSEGKSFARITPATYLWAVQIPFFPFVSIRQRALSKCSTTCWLSPTLSACLGCPSSGRHVLALLVCAGLVRGATVLYVRVVLIDAQYARIVRVKKGPQLNKFWGNIRNSFFFFLWNKSQSIHARKREKLRNIPEKREETTVNSKEIEHERKHVKRNDEKKEHQKGRLS